MKNHRRLVAASILCLFQCTAEMPVAASQEFDVTLTTSLSTRTAKVGQPVQARLISDLHDGKKLVAPAGSTLHGHVTEVMQSRRLLRAEFSTKRWMKAGAGIAMQFDQVTPPHGKPVKLKAMPVGLVSPSGNVTVDSKTGTVEAARKRDMKPKLGRTALGIASFVVGPVTAVAGAAVGAAKPSTVLPKADSAQARHHRRLKGMATGFVAGLPGGFLVNDTVLKGQQAALKSGTRLRLEWEH